MYLPSIANHVFVCRNTELLAGFVEKILRTSCEVRGSSSSLGLFLFLTFLGLSLFLTFLGQFLFLTFLGLSLFLTFLGQFLFLTFLGLPIPIPNIFGTIPIPNIFGTIPIPNIFGTIPIPNIFGIIPIPNIFARKISVALPEVYILHLTRGVVGRLSSSLWGGKMSVEQEGKRKKRVAKEKAQRK